LYPQLIDGLRYIRQKIPNAFITLNTNGILLTEDLSKKLLETKINSIAISIEGNNKEEYESIRVKLKWDVLRKNVQNIRKLIDEHNYPTKIGIMGLHVGDIEIDEDLYVKRWGAYADTMFVRNENELNDGQKESFLHQVLPCNKLLSQFVVMASGEVTMCAYDWEGEVIYGNIKNSTILELWESPILKEKRLQHLLGRKKKLDLCNNCSYRVDNPFKKSNLL
jgi:radical SAM protein with 4Fe4S-binding SPASM domain